MDLSNHCQFIGNLTKDPDVRNLDNGTTVAQFTVATNATYKNKNGEKVQDTQFHRIVAFGKIADVVSKYFTKGMRVALAGKLTHRSYQDNQGVTKYITEVVMSEFTFLGSSEKQSNQGGQQRQTVNTPAGDFPAADSGNSDDPDDLPF